MHAIPPARAALASAASWSSWGLILYPMVGPKLLANLGVAEPPLLATVREQTLYRVLGFFLLGQVGKQLGSTGAFEVELDGALIWSKLQTGSPPSLDALLAALNAAAVDAGTA